MLAQAFGVHAMAVSKKKDIDTAIKIMLQNKNQPFLIDMKI
jgi:thiamine pyrophosphate-dependent acetolactate synthase large subunit-like protein